jgi:adenylate cyclase
MPAEKEIRKLAAIMHADVKGYSLLMGEDESFTVRTLTECRKVFSDNIEKHRGRLVNAPGDSILSEFPSVVSAVQCAVEIQEQLIVKNADLPDNRKMQFRIGVNLGDVIESGDAIYGDGVNIAARIEALAEPGGVSISRTVFNHAHKKLKYGYEYLGEQQVKNIADPVQVYKLLTAPEDMGKLIGEPEPKLQSSKRLYVAAITALIVLFSWAIWNYYSRPPKFEPALVENMAFPLPDKPSIAVLPFDNLSGDPEQDYLTDGITENIIMSLSKSPNMFVIARNSTFTYKGMPIKAQQVAEELGVRFILEGSVQRSGDRLRITAQLIDSIEGYHLWAERYDRKLKDIFAVQDEITMKIVTALRVELTIGEDARLGAKSTDNLEAYLKMMEAGKYSGRLSKDSNLLARKIYKEAIALDSKYAEAYVMLAWTHLHDAGYDWTESRTASLKLAQEIAQKALTLDDSLPGAYLVLSGIHLRKREIKETIALREKAVSLNPNSSDSTALLAVACTFGGRYVEAIELFKKAIRLNPIPPNWYLHYLGATYRVIGNYEKAIEKFKKVIIRDPDFWLSHWDLAVSYGLLDREEEAQASVAELLRIRPKFSIAKVRQSLYIDEAGKQRCFEVLRKAGLPD